MSSVRISHFNSCCKFYLFAFPVFLVIEFNVIFFLTKNDTFLGTYAYVMQSLDSLFSLGISDIYIEIYEIVTISLAHSCLSNSFTIADLNRLWISHTNDNKKLIFLVFKFFFSAINPSFRRILSKKTIKLYLFHFFFWNVALIAFRICI